MFWDLLEFFKRNSRRKHLVPARGDKIPQIVGAVFGLVLGAPPLGDSPLWLDKMLGGGPWWGAAPTNGGECWEEGGAPWGNTMDKGTCFLHVWWEHVFLVWWVHVLWAEFQPPLTPSTTI